MNPALPSTMKINIRKSGVKAIFITGTDTGVGKTIVTAFLAKYMLEKECNVITQKWVQTGCSEFSLSDAAFHLKIMSRDKNDIKGLKDYILPYMFRTPSSPHLASSIENKKISAAKIVKSFKVLSKRFDFVIAEGSGGVLVPYNKKDLMIDIVKKLDLAVLVVARNELGAINHTLLAIEALKKKDIRILGIVFNNLKNEDEIILKDNPIAIKAFSRERILGVLPYSDGFDPSTQATASSRGPLLRVPPRGQKIKVPRALPVGLHKLYKKFIPIGERICKAVM